MLYRTMQDNEDMDMQEQDLQYMPNVYEANPMQEEPLWAPFMDYSMIREMNDPSTYGFQMPQLEYEIPEEDILDMERSPHKRNSYEYGYNEGYNHGYTYGYNHGFNPYNQLYQNYNPYYNFYPVLPIIPFLFNRE